MRDTASQVDTEEVRQRDSSKKSSRCCSFTWFLRLWNSAKLQELPSQNEFRELPSKTVQDSSPQQGHGSSSQDQSGTRFVDAFLGTVRSSLDNNPGESSKKVKNTDAAKLVESSDKTSMEIKNIDYKEVLQDKRLVFFADIHVDPRVRSYLSEIIGQLKDAGITHFAVEVSKDEKPAFDYLNDQKEAADLSRIKFKSALADDIRFMQMIASSGIKLVPIDISRTEQPISEEQREARLAQNLMELLDSNPEGKVAAFVGLHHARRGGLTDQTFPTLAQRIPEAQYPAVTVAFDGGESGKEEASMDFIDRVMHFRDEDLKTGIDYKISLPPLTERQHQSMQLATVYALLHHHRAFASGGERS